MNRKFGDMTKVSITKSEAITQIIGNYMNKNYGFVEAEEKGIADWVKGTLGIGVNTKTMTNVNSKTNEKSMFSLFKDKLGFRVRRRIRNR